MLIEHWLDTLPTGYRERALRNHKNSPLRTAGFKSNSQSSALCDAFHWRRSPEGYTFWDRVHSHFSMREYGAKPEPLPELPTTNVPRMQKR